MVPAEQWQCFSFICDICNFVHCKKARMSVNYKLHQAALGSVFRSLVDLITASEVNILGLLNMLITARNAEVKSLIYGDHFGPYKVKEKIGKPLFFYAAIKYTNEPYADVFAYLYDIKSVGLRYFNIFGRRDLNRAYVTVIPKWTAAMTESDTIFVKSNDEASRDFYYIDDTIQAEMLAVATENSKATNQVYNVAVGD